MRYETIKSKLTAVCLGQNSSVTWPEPMTRVHNISAAINNGDRHSSSHIICMGRGWASGRLPV